jgi:RNA polymerase sigma-70 factor (ECF subfamily)
MDVQTVDGGGVRGSAAPPIAPETLATMAYERYGAEILGALRARTRDPQAAEDLLQDAILRLYTEALAGRPPDDVRAWLHRVAANLAVSRGRRMQVASRCAPLLVDRGVGTSPEDLVVRRETHATVRSAVAELPSSDREVLLLAAAGLSGGEIGARLGRTPIAVRTHLCRARGRLRQGLGRRELAAAVSS